MQNAKCRIPINLNSNISRLMGIRADPFRVIFYFQLARVLGFCLEPKKWEIQNFFEIRPRLDTAPGAFLNCAPSNLRILIKLVLLVLDAQCLYSFLLFFREEDNGDL